MAFPWLSEKRFETGSASEWDSETDTSSKLNVEHYPTLAQWNFAPYSGAYAAHINQAIGTSTDDAVVTETGDFDTLAEGTIYVAFAVYFSGLSMAASNVGTIFSLDSAGPAAEACIDIYNNAGTIQIRGGDPGGTMRAYTLEQNKWHWVEMCAHIDKGAENDGTIDWYLNGAQVGAQVTGVNQAAITQARLGLHTITGIAGGHILFGPLIADDARIYLYYPRYPRTQNYTLSQHLFVGPGSLKSAALLSTGATDKAIFYDTDVGYTSAAQRVEAELDTTAWTSVNGPVRFERGCYLNLSGTNPRVLVELDVDEDCLYYSDAMVKLYAHNRKPVAYGI